MHRWGKWYAASICIMSFCTGSEEKSQYEDMFPHESLELSQVMKARPALLQFLLAPIVQAAMEYLVDDSLVSVDGIVKNDLPDGELKLFNYVRSIEVKESEHLSFLDDSGRLHGIDRSQSSQEVVRGRAAMWQLNLKQEHQEDKPTRLSLPAQPVWHVVHRYSAGISLASVGPYHLMSGDHIGYRFLGRLPLLIDDPYGVTHVVERSGGRLLRKRTLEGITWAHKSACMSPCGMWVAAWSFVEKAKPLQEAPVGINDLGIFDHYVEEKEGKKEKKVCQTVWNAETGKAIRHFFNCLPIRFHSKSLLLSQSVQNSRYTLMHIKPNGQIAPVVEAFEGAEEIEQGSRAIFLQQESERTSVYKLLVPGVSRFLRLYCRRADLPERILVSPTARFCALLKGETAHIFSLDSL